MTYGTRYLLICLFCFLIFLSGCSNNRNFSYQLYDGYEIKKMYDTIKLYKNDELVKINDLNYKILEFKYNSDVVCLKLENGTYYMIYYVDTTIYGPFTKESLETSINSLSMSFNSDFQNILKIRSGLIYE